MRTSRIIEVVSICLALGAAAAWYARQQLTGNAGSGTADRDAFSRQPVSTQMVLQPFSPGDGGPGEPSPLQALREKQSQTGNDGEESTTGIDAVVSVTGPDGLAVFLREAQRRGIQVIQSLPALGLVRVRVPNLDVLAQLAQETGLILKTERNLYVYAPEDPNSTEITVSSYEFGANAIRWLGLQGDNSDWGQGVTLALLDTQVSEHPAIDMSKVRVIDLVGEADPDGDYASHATAVASLLVGCSDNIQGVAPGVSLLNIQVLDSYGVGDAFTLAQGILAAVDAGAQVISMSLGAEGDSIAVREAVAYAVEHGVVVVAAAGNSGTDSVSYPACYEGVIAVGAVDAQGEKEDYSNSGEGLDLLAPGTGIYAAWDDGIAAFSGTSAAVPYVSGTAAALLAEYPEMTSSDVTQVLFDTADDNGAAGDDLEYGQGILDIGRVQQADSEGVVDAALCSHFLPEEKLTGDTLEILVNAQNRGTETIQTLTVEARIEGTPYTQYFSEVQPGETVSMSIQIPVTLLSEKTKVELTSTVSVNDGHADAKPWNDSRTSTISLNPGG